MENTTVCRRLADFLTDTSGLLPLPIVSTDTIYFSEALLMISAYVS